MYPEDNQLDSAERAARVDHFHSMMEVAKEGLQFLTVTDTFVRPGLDETLQSGEFLCQKAGDEKSSIGLDD